MTVQQKFRIAFFGSFSIQSPAGESITPRGAKARGLLALLGEATEMRRGRRWLEAKLWSDRSAAQASGSLRQVLTDIRTNFGAYADLLGADRSDIWLDATRIETDLDPNSDGWNSGREFLEGLEINDEGFEDWLRSVRARLATRTAQPDQPERAPAQRLQIRVALSEAGSSVERITGHVIADQVAQTLEEFLSAQRSAGARRLSKDILPDLEVRCDVAEDADRGVIFLRIENGQDGHVLFSGHRTVAGGLANAISATTITGLVHSAATKIVHRVPEIIADDRPESAALQLSSRGMRLLSRMDPESLDQAQSLFAHAHENDSNGVYLAWRAFTRMAQLVEGAGQDQQSHLEEVRQLTSDALQSSADNGLSIALVALTRIMLEDDLTAPADLARQAMSWNSQNLFARQTLAVAYSAVGDPRRAYELSLSCRQAAPDDDFGHLWDLYHALVCISFGRLEEAQQTALKASRAVESFVAPRRQLVALCAHAGDMQAARRYLEELKSAEAGFSLDRYLEDMDYPVLTLRKAGLIKPLDRRDLDD